MAFEDGGLDNTSTSQGMPSKPPEARKRRGRIPCGSQKERGLQHLHFGLQPAEVWERRWFP